MRTSFFTLLLSCLTILGAFAQNPDNEDINNIQSNNPFYPKPSAGSGVNIWFWAYWGGYYNNNWSDPRNWSKGSISSNGTFHKGSTNQGIPGPNDIVIFTNQRNTWTQVHVNGNFKCRRIVFSNRRSNDPYTNNIELYIKSGKKLEVTDGFFYDTEKVNRSEAYMYLESNSTLITGSLVTEEPNGDKHSSFHEYSTSRSTIVCNASSTVIMRPRDDNDNISETKKMYLTEVVNGYHNGKFGEGYGNLRLEKGGEDCLDIESIDLFTYEQIKVKNHLYIAECTTLEVNEPIIILPGGTVDNDGSITNPDKITNPGGTPIIKDFIYSGEQENINVNNAEANYIFDNVTITGNLTLTAAKKVTINGAPIKILSSASKKAFVIPSGSVPIELGDGVPAPFEIERYYDVHPDGRTRGWYLIAPITKNNTLETWSNSVYAGVFQGGTASTVLKYDEKKYAKGEYQWTDHTNWTDPLIEPGLAFTNYFYVKGQAPASQKGSAEGVINPDGSIKYSEIGELYLYEDISVPLTYSAEDPSTPDNGSRNGYNLLANPYPFPLSMKKLRLGVSNGTANSSMFRNTILVRDAQTKSYDLYSYSHKVYAYLDNSIDQRQHLNGDFAIAPGQAFFVKTKSNNGAFDSEGKATLILKPNMRYTNGDPNSDTKNYRTENPPPSDLEYFRLNIETNKKPIYQTVMAFTDKASAKFDDEEDVYMPPLISKQIATTPAIGDYTPLAINIMPFPENQKKVHLILHGIPAGIHRLRFHDASTLLKDKDIRLKDKLTGNITRLSDSVYTFTLAEKAIQLKDRFEIILGKKPYAPDLSVRIPDTLKAPATEKFKVPLKAKGFQNVRHFEGIVTWDSKKMRLLKTESQFINIVPSAEEGKLKLTYNNALVDFSLANNGVLANLTFELNPNSNETNLKVSEIKATVRANDNTTYLTEALAPDSCHISEMPETNLSIRLVPYQNVNIENVTYTVNKDDNTEKYNIENGNKLDISSYSGKKIAVNATADNTGYAYVSVGDLLKTREYILQSFHPNYFSDAQMDVNADGKVSTADLQSMRQVILGLQGHFKSPEEDTWHFFPDKNISANTYDYTSIDPKLEMELGPEQNKATFWAVRKGDPFNSEPSTENRMDKENVTLKYNSDTNGDLITVHISTDSPLALKAMQSTLEWNPDALRLSDFSFKDGIRAEANAKEIENGKLPFLWTDDEGIIPNDFLRLEFSILDKKTSPLQLNISSSVTQSLAYDDQLNAFEVVAKDKTIYNGSGYSVSAYPNPVSEGFFFEFKMEKSSDISISIYAPNGNKLINASKSLKAGISAVKLSRGSLPAGIYIYRTMINETVHTGKIILK
ncbi:hypothetical protein FUAX_45950 (plasmid) [Fulvitalea axinellae]|uniref:Secretion system C-terminal sorting domain-containing protein n=1 Tax=Fulvitalea axinellae TaxID=1182444 RepID=A0AAU9CPI5_9BACT|nr:hypothetical protein FUAX_45950 [Fulvitalea axinellae]